MGTGWGILRSMRRPPEHPPISRRHRRRCGAGLLLAAALALAGCEREEAADEGEKKSVFNLDAYQGFFAHYPFGGHPVETWAERLNALAPGGAEQNPAAYRLARGRAEQAGLLVTGEGQNHTVRITPALLEKLIDHVDKQKESP